MAHLGTVLADDVNHATRGGNRAITALGSMAR